jgi:hypothetical protein
LVERFVFVFLKYYFFKKLKIRLIFFIQIIFFGILDRFNVLISKIFFEKKIYFAAFSRKNTLKIIATILSNTPTTPHHHKLEHLQLQQYNVLCASTSSNVMFYVSLCC